ncbi:MAG TPA: hypothetical protein DHN29_05575 [Cytophagales bacterium]|nr:hypothetical protein [Cytophagales bacterium]
MNRIRKPFLLMNEFGDRKTRPQYQKTKERIEPPVQMPAQSYGICINSFCSLNKKQISSDLGNGLCMQCFDRSSWKKFRHYRRGEE